MAIQKGEAGKRRSRQRPIQEERSSGWNSADRLTQGKAEHEVEKFMREARVVHHARF